MSDCPGDKTEGDLQQVILHFVEKLRDDLKDLDKLLSGLDPWVIDQYKEEQVMRRNRCIKLLDVLHGVVDSENKREVDLAILSDDERLKRKKEIFADRLRDADKIMTLMQKYNLISASELAQYLSGTLDKSTISNWSSDNNDTTMNLESVNFKRQQRLYQPSKANEKIKRRAHKKVELAQTP